MFTPITFATVIGVYYFRSKKMKQSFEVSVAEQYGITEAIIFEIIREGIVKNRTRLHGEIWTFLPYSSLSEKMPYVSRNTIMKAVKHLESEKLIVKHTRFLPIERGGCEGNYFKLSEKGEQITLGGAA